MLTKSDCQQRLTQDDADTVCRLLHKASFVDLLDIKRCVEIGLAHRLWANRHRSTRPTTRPHGADLKDSRV